MITRTEPTCIFSSILFIISHSFLCCAAENAQNYYTTRDSLIRIIINKKKGTKIQHINVYSLYKFSYRYFMKTHQTWLLPKTLYFSLDYILILPSSSCHHFTFHVVFCIRFHFTRQQLKIFLVQCKFLLLFTVAQQRQPKFFFFVK